MLEIVGLTYNDLPPVVPVAGTISGSGATIGRGENNAIVLPDPKRVISRQHLEFILGDGNVYRIRNIGSGNPVFINDMELVSGVEHPLQNHDRILVGGYVLQVAYVGQSQKSALGTQPAKSSTPGDTGGDVFLADLLGSSLSDVSSAGPGSEKEQNKIPDPFQYGTSNEPNDIMQMLNERGVDPGSLDGKGDELINSKNVGMTMDELLQDPLNTPMNQQLPYDKSLDPLAMFGEVGVDGDVGDILQSGKGRASNIPSGMDLTHGSELGALFHLPDTGENPLPGLPETAHTPLVEPHIPDIGNRSTENATNAADFDDIDDLIAGLLSDSEMKPGAEQSAVDPLPAFSPDVGSAAAVLPPLTSDTPARVHDAPSVSSASSVGSGSAAGTAEELYQAFIEGLGMELPARGTLDKAFMKTLGQALRNYTQGTVELIAGRAVVKQAVRANVTVIAPERNNPLKFSPDGNTALMGMFGGRPLPGFLGPAEAIHNAFVDLRAHQIGVISGMQAALNHVLDSFNPATLGNVTPPRGLIENTFSVAYKARLWSEYGRYFYTLREKANDHFQEFFGKAFLDAYDKAILTVQSGDRTSRS
ncbi:MAG: type VI secretion system-associated FHA domain protein TagH [Azoarcus sp.]|nr:type VI secretion system-associated FHA domain protein TagH [Azoarcus sp.]